MKDAILVDLIPYSYNTDVRDQGCNCNLKNTEQSSRSSIQSEEGRKLSVTASSRPEWTQ
jgi:hypothetical protein